MPKKFTNKWIDTVKLPLKEKEGRGYADFYDSECTGLILRVGKKAKTFYAENRAAGVNKTKLGRSNEITLDEARDKARQLFKKPIASDVMSHGNLTLAEYIDNVFKVEAPYSNATNKIQGLDNILLSKKMRQIVRSDVELWIERRIRDKNRYGNNIKPATARREYNSLRTIFKYAEDKGVVEPHCISGIKIKGIDSGFRKSLTVKELEKVFEKIEKHASPYLKVVWQLMLLTGARPKELLNAKKTDYHFNSATLTVPASFSKTGKTRTISFSHTAYNVLQDWLMSDFYLENCQHNNDEEYIFWNNKQKTPGPIQSLSKEYTRFVRKHNLPEHTMYSLRHSFATYALRNNDIETVRELLGHSDIRTTQIYVSTDTKQREKAANKVSEVFNFADDSEKPWEHAPESENAKWIKPEH